MSIIMNTFLGSYPIYLFVYLSPLGVFNLITSIGSNVDIYKGGGGFPILLVLPVKSRVIFE